MAKIRTILVTGSNQGLGMHTAHQLGSIPNVVVFMGSLPLQLDITDDSSIEAAHATIDGHLKGKNLRGLDVLINNAAILTPSFKETYEVNVFGTAAVTESILPLINPGGAILNISSIAGSLSFLQKTPDVLLFPAYSSSKSALNNLTVEWALQEQRKGSRIRVVSICPGFNSTKMNNHTGTISPAEGCQVIVKAALDAEGRTGVYFNKDGDLQW
ncbi:short chain oxidoreductase [Mycena vulgaris]|nr:short chain oxidoreductase [Mycena vulgaris]